MADMWILGALLVILCAQGGYSNSLWDCNFEKNLCNYHVSPGSRYFTWKWRQSTSAGTVKPYTDHTYQQRGKGWYMAVSGGYSYTGTATLQAGTKLDTGAHCLTFYMFQTGQWLNGVYVKLGTNNNLLVRTGKNEGSSTAHDIWHKIEVDIPKMDSPGTLSFVVTKTEKGNSLVAIDDIAVTPGACSKAEAGPVCTFERGLCGWDNYDATHFKLASKLPTSKFTTFDHTLATKYGHFMLANVGGANVNKAAVLRSPALNTTGPQCVRFFYIIFGDGRGDITAGRSRDQRALYSWSLEAHSTGKWQRAEVRVDTLKGYNIVIKYDSKSAKGEKYIAIDDVSLEPGLCPERVSVTFESGLLDPWRNYYATDLDWSVVKAGKDTHKPKTDITLGTNQGHVAFVTGGGKGKSAILSDAYGKPTASSCMSFYVYASGNDPGTISVILNLKLANERKVWWWTPTISERNKFVRAEFSHNFGSYYRTFIKVDMGSDGSWAIDDIKTFSSPTCQDMPATSQGRTIAPTQFPTSPATTPLPKNGYYDCNFDKDLCHWSMVGTSRKGWKQTTGHTFSSVHPKTDHTRGSSLGKFLHIGTGYSTDKAVIESPQIGVAASDNFGPKGCLSFWYYVWAPSGNGAQLIVQVISDSYEYTAFNATQQTQEWTQAKVDLNKNIKMKLRIEAKVLAYSDDISIDDVVYTVTPCKDDKVIGSGCGFEHSDICGFTQFDKDDFDWQWHAGDPKSPFPDHDTNTLSGHVMLLKGVGHKVGQTATLISPPIDPMNGCLVFWLYGSRYSGDLKVSTKVSRRKTILSKHMDKKNRWVKVEVPLYSDKKFSLVFQGAVTSTQSTENFLALDDLRLLQTDCETKGACSYEINGLCTWSTSNTGKILPRVIRAMDVKEQVHPGKDHTLNLATGHVLFINPKSHRFQDQAIYESPSFAKSSQQCMEFVLSNSGMAFMVYVVPFGNEQVIVYRTYKSNKDWHRISISVGSTKAQYVVRFVAEVRYSTNGGVAIDDITFSNGKCGSTSSYHIEPTPAPVTPAATLVPALTWATVSVPSSPFDCDFEDTKHRYCSWTLDTVKVKEVWFITSAKNVNVLDHTSNSVSGNFLTSGKYGKVGAKARLVSPDVPKGQRCLIFYMMSPMLGGNKLTVYKSFNNLLIPAYHSPAEATSTDWQRVEVSLASSTPYKVIFQTVRETSMKGAIYIDDIKIPTGDCPKDTLRFRNVRCNFEDGQRMCGFSQDSTDDYDWVLSSPQMTFPSTAGRFEDRTMGTSEGHFMLGKLGTNKPAGSKARLISPPYVTEKNTKHCLSFFYHMNGDTIGHLNVYVAPDGKQSLLTPAMLKWSRHYGIGTQWRRAFVQIQQPGTYRVVFEIVRSGTDYAYGIDDLFVQKGVCPSKVSCSFEDGTCLWATQGFLLAQPYHEISNHRSYSIPPNDHTTSSPTGHFLFLPTTAGDKNVKAQMLDVIRGATNDTSCFSFWYHMHGNDAGTLTVLVSEAKHNATPSVFREAILWELKPNNGDDQWHSAQVPVPPLYTQGPFQIIVEYDSGEVTTSGDVSIDDTAFAPHKCVLTPDSANPVRQMSDEIACSFDDGNTCLWKRQRNQKGDMAFQVVDQESTYVTIYDHTWSKMNHAPGKFLVLSSRHMPKGTEGIISSPVMPPTGGTSCLNFWYIMNPSGDPNEQSQLKLSMKRGTDTKQEWAVSRSPTWAWQNALVNLHSDYEYQLIFQGMTGKKDDGSLAIDDIKMSQGPCQRTDNCEFSKDMCEFTPTKDSDFDWKRVKTTDAVSPLPTRNYDNTWGDSYLATVFKNQTQGDKAILRSKLYSPTQGECLSLYIASGFNTNVETDNQKVKGSFSVKKIPQNGDGSEGTTETVYTMVINENRSWREVHFTVMSKTHYRLILEADVTSPSGYVAVDDFLFSSSPCPSDLNCDFENNNACGYSNIGDIDWYLAKSGLMSEQLGTYEHDHTTGTSNGHYMLYEYDVAARAGYQEARLSSYLQPSHDQGQCLTLWFTGYGKATLGIGTATTAGEETTLVQKTIAFEKHSQYQDYAWDYLRVDVPAKQRFFLDVWVKSNAPGTTVAVDDLEAEMGTCEDIDKKKAEKTTKPYYDPSKKFLGCTFETQDCQGLAQAWSLSNAGTSSSTTKSPPGDHTFGNVRGHYLMASSATTPGKAMVKEYSASGRMCLDFYLDMYGDKNTTFNVYTTTADSISTLQFVRQGDMSLRGWSHETVEIGGNFQNHQLQIEATFENDKTAYVAIDDLFIYKQPCQPTRQCEFEDDGWCGYTQDNSDDFDWIIQQPANATKAYGPGTDHTLRTKEGHYAMFKMDTTLRSETASLVSPMYNAKDAQCLQFYYNTEDSLLVGSDTKNELSVSVRDESGKQVQLIQASGKTGNVWTKALLPIETDKVDKLQFVFTGTSNSVDGSVSIDDVTVSDQPCHELINCDFTVEPNFCGWQNNGWNSYSWRQYKLSEGATLTISGNSWSSSSTLQSQLIPVFPVADYCLTIKYAITGKAIHNLAVYLQTEKGKEYLMLNQQAGVDKQSGTLYVPSKTTLYAESLRVRIKAFYTKDPAEGKVNLYNVELHNSPCNEVKEQVTDSFTCSDNTTLPSSKVCDFANDCTDGSDEQQCGSCTFENGYCGWVDQSSGESSFLVTTNFSVAGDLNTHLHYLLLKNGDEDAHHHADVVFRKSLGPTPAGCSVTFDYFAESFNRGYYSKLRYPIDYGTVAMVVDIGGDQTTVWQNPRGTSDKWHSARVDIGHIRHRFKLHFEAEHYSYIRNVIAIDNIKLEGCHFPDKSEGRCTNGQNPCKGGGCVDLDRMCDMEANCRYGDDEVETMCAVYIKDNFEYGLGHWSQSTNDDFDWVRLQGKSSDLANGAKRDHTLGTNRGHYLAIEGNGNHQKGEMARLNGPILDTPMKGKTCRMTLYTHRFDGVGDATLKIFKRTSLKGAMDTIGTVLVDDADGWNKHEFQLPSDKPFQVVIEGVVGSYHSSDIGIDDVIFSPFCRITTSKPLPDGVAPTQKPSVCKDNQFACTSGKVLCIDKSQKCDWISQCDDGSDEKDCGPCTFESGTCGWNDVSDGRVMFQALNASKATGVEPTLDHTISKANSGSYLRLVSGYGDTGTTARLLGPTLSETSVSCQFGLYFYKKGPTTGTITIGVQNPANLYRNQDIVAKLPFHSLHYATWLPLSAQFGKLPAGYQPFVEIVSSSVNDDIAVAIDDIYFKDCEPNKIYNISGANCDFENGMCEWFNNNFATQKWMRTAQSTPMDNTGPDRDHTTGSGYYVYVTSPQQNIGTDKVVGAVLRSALLQWPQGSQTGCLSFWYLMYGVYVQSLDVYVVKDKNVTNLVFSKTFSQGNVWRQGFATIETSGNFQIEFVATIPNALGDIALDDITLTSGACPVLPRCDFEFGLCGFQASPSTNGWTVIEGNTKLSAYPHKDNTLRNQYGHYLAIDYSNLAASATPTLTSPVYSKTQAKMCLTLFMYYNNKGPAVNVYVKSKGDNGKDVKVLTINTVWASWFEYVQHTISPTDDYQIIFEASIDKKSAFPIALDDFRIEDGACPSLGSCDFEKNDCGYYTSTTSRQKLPHWQRNSGYYVNEKTGPPVDHTTKTEEGFYMLADSYRVSAFSSSNWFSTDKFVLESPMLASMSASSSQVCVSFWYYMNGNSQDMSTFQVSTVKDSTQASTMIFTVSKSMGERWNYQAFNVSVDGPYQITFTTQPGHKGESDVGLDDIRVTDGDCTQRNSSTLTPEVPKSYPPTKFDCNFEQGSACNWTVDQGSNATLKVVTKSSKMFSAEPYDHTKENEKGHFLRFWSTNVDSDNSKQRSKATATSPVIDQHSITSGTCLKFWYMITENAFGYIGVMLMKDNGKSDNLWFKYSDDQSTWMYAQIHVSPTYYASRNATNMKFEILFVARTGKAEFRIDDISLNDGPCLDQLQHCGFEETSVCGFVQDKTESLDWQRFPYKAPFYYSSKKDHTYGSGFGHYMYLYSPTGGSDTASGRMVSPVVDVDSGQCLRFFYYMTASGVKTKLRVKAVSEEDSEMLLLEIAGNHNGLAWQAAQAPLHFVTPSKIVLEGIPGGYRHTFIGVDDMSLLPYQCPKPATCDFERDFCLFSNTHGNDHFDWLRHSGPTTSFNTGPSVDATTQTNDGHYIFIESSKPRINGDRAEITSESLPPTSGGCLSFSYFMHGKSLGQLNVFQYNEVDSKKSSQLLLSLQGDKGPQWNQTFINVTSQYNFHFGFEGVIGKIVHSDIALDDIAYSEGLCAQPNQEASFTCFDGSTIDRSQVCDFVGQCTNREDEDRCGSCNFEYDLCGYVAIGSQSYKFRRGKSGDIADGYLGNDHTLGTKYGHTAFISGTPSFSTQYVYLKSRLLQRSYQTCALQFYYKLMNSYAAIKVELEFSDSSRVQIFTASKTYNYGSWMQGNAQIGYVSAPFHVVFSGRKMSRGIPFAIDDIFLNDCGPPSPPSQKDDSMFTCKNGYQIQKRELCDLADDCGDGSDEINCQNTTACDFEKSFCTWSRVRSSGMGSWVRDQGFDLSYGAGPLRDHTTGTPSGHFLYLRHSLYNQRTDAKIISQVIQGVKDGDDCRLTIYYQMRGLSNQALLNVYLQTEDGGYTTKLFTKHYEHQEDWDRIILSLSSTSSFQIVIEGSHLGFESNSEIGLDDLVFSSGCRMASSSATLPTPSGPLTTQKKTVNKCPYINQFQCGNGTCIDEKLVCDYNNDCDDGSDEFNCGSCDFENGWCGWYDSSTGRIAFARGSSDEVGKLGPDQDASLKTSKGHYLYTTLSSGTSNSPAVIKSGPLRPPSSYCYITLSVYNGDLPEIEGEIDDGDTSTIQYTAVTADSSYVLGTSVIQPYMTGWFRRYIVFSKDGIADKLTDGWHLEISFQYLEDFSPPKHGKFALDSFKFTSCSRLTVKPKLTCSFSNDLCDWTQSKKDIFDWKRVEDTRNLPNPTPEYYWDKTYLLATSEGQRANDVAIIESPQLPSQQKDRCLTFYYYLPGSRSEVGVIQNHASTSYTIFVRYASGNPGWQKAYVSSKSSDPYSLEIRATVSGDKGDDVIIDEIEFSRYTCEEIQGSECTFEDNDMCTWKSNQSSQLEWSVHNGISLMDDTPLPKTDHTTLTKYGYFAYLPVNDDNAGQKATISSAMSSDNAHSWNYYYRSCFTFWYHMIGGKSPQIEIYLNSSATYKKVATYPGPTENMWRRGSVSVAVDDADTIFVQGSAQGGSGYIAIDDTNLVQGSCDYAGECFFRSDLCGYINSPSNKFNFIVESPTYRRQYAIAKPTANTKKGDTALLISDPIGQAGCLEFQAYMKSDSMSQSIAAQTLNVYTRELASPQNKTLVKTIQYFARNSDTPFIEVDVTAYRDFEVVFEAVNNGVPGDTVALTTVTTYRYNCSQTPAVTTTVMPSAAPSVHPPSPLDCHFESNLCGWQLLTAGYAKWKLNSQPGRGKVDDFEDFNVWYDHTLNSIEGGFLEASVIPGSSDNNKYALIVSPKVDTKDGMCFQFWYYMFGTEVGELKLVLNTKTTLWSRVGPQRPQWNQASVHLRTVKEAVLSFEAGGMDRSSGIAIDDVSAFYGQCPETNGCDFENGNCDYNSYQNGYAPWTLKSGMFLEKLVAPLKGDHTVGTYTGWALAMDPTSMRAQRFGRFTTTRFTATTDSCLTFWYHMKGSDKLALQVFKQDSNYYKGRTVVSVRGSQGPGWQLGTIDVQESSSFSLTFEGHIEENDMNAAIVVDDIKMVDGKCPRFATCDFEDNLCGWTNLEEGDASDWMPFRGDLLISLSYDHTMGTKHGNYLIAGNKAVLVSPTFEHGIPYCLSLWAALATNQLAVATMDFDGNELNLIDSKKRTVTDPNPTSNGWKQYQFDVSQASSQFQIMIESQVSGEHILLDDLAVYNQTCADVKSSLHRSQQFYCSSSKNSLPISKKCDFTVDCAGDNEEAKCGYNCDFESNSACKWANDVQDVSRPGKWKIGSGATLTSKTIKSLVDHTYRTANGHFLFNLPATSYHYPSLEKYISPILQSSAARCEFQFSYYRINPNTTYNFVVLKIQKDVETYLMSFKGAPYFAQPRWVDMRVPLGRNDAPFYVEVSLTQRLHDQQSPDILLDDFSFKQCALPSKSSCTGGNQFACRNSACVSNEARCNLQDDCGDGSDEDSALCGLYDMTDFEDGSFGAWQQEIGTDEFDWHVRKAVTFGDHTLRSASGHIASAINAHRKYGDSAHIISHAVAANSLCKLTLSYKMDIGTTGQFNLYKRYAVNGDLSLIASPVTPMGKYKWETFSQVLSDSKPYQIVLEIKAAKNRGTNSIVVDDIILDNGCTMFNGTLPVEAPKPRPTPTPAACSSKQFSCHQGSGCIPLSQVCDFLYQCSDKSDEALCSACDFDSGSCGWTDARGGQYQWKYAVTSSTDDIKSDHTQSATAPLHGVMHIERNSWLVKHTPALKSVTIGATSPSCVLNFWAYVKNTNQSQLRVVHVPTSRYGSPSPKSVLNSFSLKDLPQGVWTEMKSTIGYQKIGGVVELRVTSIDTNPVIAIDDVSFSNCAMGAAKEKCAIGEVQCGNKACISSNQKCDGHMDCADGTDERDCYAFERCDFTNRDLCELTPDPTAGAKWNLSKGGDSDTSGLIPARGHTHDWSDYFLLMKSSNQSQTNYARLRSPVVYTGTSPGVACQISFFYYQQTNIGRSINVYTQYVEDGPLQLQWSNKAGTDGLWKKALIALKGKKAVRIVLEGLSKKDTAVAVDDLWLSRGCELSYDYRQRLPVLSTRTQGSCKFGSFQCDGNKCIPNIYACDRQAQCQDGTDEMNCGVPCNFENGVCGWSASVQGRSRNLTTTGLQESFNVTSDVNPGTPQGHVIVGSQTNYWDRTVFDSPFYAGAYGSCKFSIWHTSNPGSFVYIDADNGGLTDSLAESTLDSGRWTKLSVQMPECMDNFHLSITSRNSKGKVPVIFDDFNWESCPAQRYVSQCKTNEFECADKQKCIPVGSKCDLAMDCCDGSDEDTYTCHAYLRFTFDWGFGGWKQHTDDEADWHLESRVYSSHKIYDHTSGSRSSRDGDFLAFSSYNTGYKAKLSLAMEPPLQDCYMRLWYAGVDTMPDDAPTLNLYIQPDPTTMSKLRSVQAIGGWKRLDVYIVADKPYSIVLEAVAGLIYNSYVYVDDISFSPGCAAASFTLPPSFVPPTTVTPPASITTMTTPTKKAPGTNPPGKTTQSTTTITPAPPCPNQFQCKGTKKCIPLSKVCDFNKDCLDHSDEDGCYTLDVCDFTRDMCGWKSSSSSSSGIDWVVDTPSGAKQGQAPTYDADFEQGTSGHFVYLRDSGTGTASKSALSVKMDSLSYKAAAASCMVSFSYFMTSSQISLSLNIIQGSNKYLIWSTASATDNKWKKAMVSIGRRGAPFSLEFVRSVNTNNKGITAIDDIKFSLCAEPREVDVCKPMDTKYFCNNKACIDNVHRCDGQDDCGDNSDESTYVCGSATINKFDRGFNGLRQIHHHDTLDWQIWLSPANPAYGLPGIDHSTFTSSGRYAYAVGTKPGDSAWLMTSNWITADPDTAYCKGSIYVMAPDSHGTLSIGIVNHNMGKVDKWIHTVGSTGSVWTSVNFSLSQADPFSLVFKADFDAAGGAVAIDDFIMKSSCKPYNKDLPNINCPASKFECHTDQLCIDVAKRCDGTRDCKDGTDEYNCPSKTTTTTPTTSRPTSKTAATNPPATPTTTTQKHTAQKSVSSSSSSSWKTPVGVVLGLVALLAIVVVVIFFLKKRQHLSWLTLPNMRTNLRSRDQGMENPLYEYGSGSGSGAGSDFQLDDMGPKHPDDIFGDSTKTSLGDNAAFDNPMYKENASES